FILRLIVSQGLLGICTRDFLAIKSENNICQEIWQMPVSHNKLIKQHLSREAAKQDSLSHL
ncbi:MAG: hypothetical protein WA098_11605, partial [Smithella sp.]